VGSGPGLSPAGIRGLGPNCTPVNIAGLVAPTAGRAKRGSGQRQPQPDPPLWAHGGLGMLVTVPAWAGPRQRDPAQHHAASRARFLLARSHGSGTAARGAAPAKPNGERAAAALTQRSRFRLPCPPARGVSALPGGLGADHRSAPSSAPSSAPAPGPLASGACNRAV